jgi:hypothetical protein
MKLKQIIMAIRYPVFLTLYFWVAGNLYAGEINHEGLEPVPAPPQLPDPLVSGETIEPEVTIIRKDDATIEEYRVNGQLYMVKITPLVGKPYYLLDNDGDGRLEARMNDLVQGFVVPQWVILSW